MKNSKYIVLGLLLSATLSVSARTFLANDEIRVYTDQTYHDSQIHWDYNYSALWLYLFNTNSSANKWIQLEYKESNIFAAIIPQGESYNRLVLVRKAQGGGSGWDNIVNQTCNIRIPDDASCNVLYKFWKKEGDCNDDAYSEWKTYTPAIDQLQSTIPSTAETIEVCPQAVGTFFSLHPNIKSDKTDYDYENVYRHTWLRSTDGKATWTSLDGYAGVIRDEEKEKDYDTYLPDPIPAGGVYYYLYSLNPSGRRLIHVKSNAAGCDLDCEITAFETANSAVNADNNTFTLDGMVAFGEANGKALKIECGGQDTTIATPKSPQSFSLEGVPAATTDGQKATAKAYFIGGGDACSWEIQIDVPNATVATDTTRVDSLTGTQYVLLPTDTVASNQFIWLKKNEATGQLDTLKGVTSKRLVIDAFGHDSTVTYIYKEYNPAPGSMENLMTNGSYEDDTWDYDTKKVSEYKYWGTFPETANPPSLDFYTNPTVNPGLAMKDSGFAIVRNASNFAHTYAAVEARDGVNFALFDAKSGASGADKKAWYATTSLHPNLKLKAGTTYVLSFWAANINNYGEMDNAAEFEFLIETASGALIAKSKMLKLSDAKFHNNSWHQLSETFTAEADYDNIVISVVNRNKKALKVGNDFALDDIQFHPISSVSRNVKSQQVFVVTAHEPKIDVFTATVVPLGCDAKPKYTIQMHVEYQNPNGKIVIKDDLSNTYTCSTTSVAFDTKAVLDTNIVITGLTPATHTWEAYFEEWTTAKISDVTTTAPVVPTTDTLNIALSEPGCTDKTTTLTFNLAYTYQQGTFTYWVDDLTQQNATYNTAKTTSDTLKALTVAGIHADGKNDHVLHISFDGANSCVKNYTLPAVPFSPVINKVTIDGVPTTVPCGTTAYDVTVKLEFPYDASGREIILTYDSLGTTKTTTPIALTKFPYTLTLYNLTAGSKDTVYAAFSTSPTCTTPGGYTLPEMTSCIRDTATVCESDLPYWWPNANSGEGKYCTGSVGENRIGVGTDSLWLFVIATPDMTFGTATITCDDADSIRIPLTEVVGNPDSIVITIGPNPYDGIISGTDLAFARASEFVAGDYSANVTFGTKGTTCTQTKSFRFTVALGGAVYSKWTDVLFVSNAGNQFVSYQWYENGIAMSGETQQRLYRPKGLPGSYYCQLVTTDGKTVYTCEQTFDQIQPSRSEGAKQTTVIRKYRVSPHVYIVQTETDGIIETKKILTPYE